MTPGTLDRRAFLQSMGAVLSPASKPLNFVFILVDDWGWTDAGCYGSQLYETPNIDRLAARGARFTNAYAAAPLCSPTRASILTGKSPARLKMTTALPGTVRTKPSHKWVSPEMPPGLLLSERTIAERLKPAGYVSASIGKWHLGGREYDPRKSGFEVNIGGFDGGMAPSQFYPGWKGKSRGVPLEGRPGEYLADRLTDEAIRFIEVSREQPFFLYLAHYSVHTPIEAKSDLTEKYRRRVDPSKPQHHPTYAAMMESVDQSVGRVARKLDELGLASRTVIFVASDNGGVNQVQTYTPDPLPPTANLPLRAGKAWLYEGGIRSPLVVYWPGNGKPRTVCEEPVISADFFPTMVEMAGLKRDAQDPVDGMSLVPLLKGQRIKREALYWYFPHYDFRPTGAVRKGDFKLIEFYDDDHAELYNLAKDIGEQHNLADSMPQKTAELRGMLQKWLKASHAPMMNPNPAYQPPGL